MAKVPAKRPAKGAAPKAAKAKAPAAKRAAKKAPKRLAPKPAQPREASAPRSEAPLGWLPAEGEDEGQPAASLPPPPPARATRPAFDPATGDWIPAVEPAPSSAAAAPTEAAVAPDAPRRSTAATVWNVILGIDLGILGLFLAGAIWAGLVLLLAPDSDRAEQFREQLEGGSTSLLALNALLNLLLFGLIPLFWVVGTRQQPLEGAKRFLQMHKPALAILQGIGLTVVLLVGVITLVTLYTLATDGPDGVRALLNGESDDENPAVQGLLDVLTWPVAVLVAVTAGFGEEILFRGLLRKWLGTWGQAALFGVFHLTGGYLPQVAFAFLMGLGFGFWMKRGGSIWALIIAHTLYDFTLLSMALVAG